MKISCCGEGRGCLADLRLEASRSGRGKANVNVRSGRQIPAVARCGLPPQPRLHPASTGTSTLCQYDSFSVLLYSFLPHIFCRFALHLLRCCVSETTCPSSVTTSTSFAKVSQATSAGPKHKSSLMPAILGAVPPSHSYHSARPRDRHHCLIRRI